MAHRELPRLVDGPVAVLGQCLSLGPMLVYTLGVFAKPLTTEFKTSRGAISLALTLTNLMSAVAALGAGWLVDRLGHGASLPARSWPSLAACSPSPG
jgi:hypothetical protein